MMTAPTSFHDMSPSPREPRTHARMTLRRPMRASHSNGNALTSRQSVERLVRSIAERVGPIAEKAGVHVLVDCGGGTVDTDDVDLGEALFNLLVTAIRATPPGGAVGLETRELDDGAQRWLLCDVDEIGRPADSVDVPASRHHRIQLATVRVVADELERCFDRADEDDVHASIRIQLADELEHLANALRR